ncbi:hypothetical protein MalM25_07040 [Planctomycetes bacterium MalM25]|nr:hypothetical protein MalM25_07040 [Planctomycetes bacterium MalM25]
MHMDVRALRCLALVAAVSIALPLKAAVDVRGQWRMDDGVATTVADGSGFGNDGRARRTEWVSGALRSALQIQPGGWIDCGSDDSLNITEQISLEGWVKPWSPRWPQRPTLLRKQGAYALYLGPRKGFSVSLWFDGKEETVSSTELDFPAGQWRHLAATFDGQTVRLYFNGKLDTERHFEGPPRGIDTSSSPLYLASMSGRHAISGTLDEIRVAASVMSPDQIANSFREAMAHVYRSDNKFTDFYEKSLKVKPEELVSGVLWIDAEDFDDYGGWWMDTQFVPQMGSPYLMAAGTGKPVSNASTTIEVPTAGRYRLWVRNKNWLAEGHAPGRFKVRIDGSDSDATFGTGNEREWAWQDGGFFDLEQGEIQLELNDLTGYYGRCDALILSRDPDFVPAAGQGAYAPMRKRLVRDLPSKDMGHFDVVVVGAGVAGCNAAIAAARGGATVALVQNRPLVGGNNSSEMGVPVSGGSSSGKGREAGLNEEAGRISAFMHNQKWAAGAEVLLAAEPNVTVFLNSHVFAADTDDDNRITAVTSFDMVDGHLKRFSGDYFADCTGDGWLGYYAGAKWMLGRESKGAYGESNAREQADKITMSGSLMQHSILGYQALDAGEPVKHEAPDWVYDLRENEEGYVKRPRFENGVRSGNWWTENHGDIDDLWDPEWARDDLVRVSLSYYNWIKNHSPLAEQATNYELTYIPVTNAKRETRRLVGDLVLSEDDVVNRTVFPDRVGYFVWKLDVHHPLGIFSPGSPYDFETNISPASIPLRILYSKDVPNLFMAGRNVSVTHVALGTARVQGTTGMMGQAVGTAAAMCISKSIDPRDIYQSHMPELQQQLLKDDITILHLRNEDPGDLARTAQVSASSSRTPEDGPHNAINGLTRPLDDNMEMWIGKVPNNMWISDPEQAMPQWLEFDLGAEKTFDSAYLTFDTNLKTKRYASWQFKDSERMPPECARDYRLQYHDGSDWVTVAEEKNNYQRRRVHRFAPVTASRFRVLLDQTNGDPSARVYEVRLYREGDAASAGLAN